MKRLILACAASAALTLSVGQVQAGGFNGSIAAGSGHALALGIVVDNQYSKRTSTVSTTSTTQTNSENYKRWEKYKDYEKHTRGGIRAYGSLGYSTNTSSMTADGNAAAVGILNSNSSSVSATGSFSRGRR